jgi:hypothetical protein
MVTIGLAIYLFITVFMFAIGYVEITSGKTQGKHRAQGKVRSQRRATGGLSKLVLHCYLWWVLAVR